ncbi:molybdate ABC transporter substrate-binding protein [Candidatus Electronema sp. JC]|uniref:molybdate ABC transporter substrate-binding protein n=1 Tax=Candidatus Electronema sp. JC TaxID=3401570 RepID=UPI003B437E21
MKWKLVLAALFLNCCAAAGIQAETIHLSAAASMTDACKEIIAAYEAKQPGAKVLANFGASGALAKQIEQGAPADVFISASTEWVQHLADKQMAAPGSEKTFAGNSLVFVGSAKAAVLSMEKLPELKRVAIGNPKNVPAGQYAKQAMEKAGIYAALEQGQKFVLTDDVRHALMYADQGEVDGAFVYATDALLAKTAKTLFTVDAALHEPIIYPMLLTAAGAKNAAAKAFYDYLSGAEAKAALKKHGFAVNP